MPYEIKGKCIYKKDGGAKVGCTKGDVHKYMAALHANVDEDIIKGGKADKMSVEDIAKKHGVSIEQIQNQIKKGIKIEMEHVDTEEEAREIAMDHLTEIPDYYDRLNKMEKDAGLDETRKLLKKLIRNNLK